MGHDQTFKELLWSFLQEFLELFFPEAAARLDFDTVRFQDRELFTDFPEGSRREPDVVAEIRTREGETELVVVHVEVQSEVRGDEGQRMLEYYGLLSLRFDAPVFPILMLLQGGGVPAVGTAEHRHELFGREILRFRYATVSLARLAAREYVETSPLGAALAALMDRRNEPEPIVLRARMLNRVATSSLDEDRKRLLVNVIETYFRLSAVERESFGRLIAREEFRKVQEIELTWRDELIKEGLEQGLEKGREQGLEQGLEQGVVQGKRDTLKRLLTTKFRSLPAEVEARIESLSFAAELDRYLERLIVATTLEEVGLGT